MNQTIGEKVSVSFTYNHDTQEVSPKWINWKGRLYPVSKIGLHHKFRQGAVLYHVFSVTSKTMFLRLILDTSTLHWRLEEISDMNSSYL